MRDISAVSGMEVLYAAQMAAILATVTRATNRIRQIRRQLETEHGREYSARACAERAGISERAWWSYETMNVDPPATRARAIARVLGVTFEELDFRPIPGTARSDQEETHGV
jgi:transcriptional regulator with XRE-family HTH domain